MAGSMASPPDLFVRGMSRCQAPDPEARAPERRLRRPAVLALWAALALGVGCQLGPRAGEPCRVSGRTVCASPADALVCEGGQWRARQCQGDRGCARRERDEFCDDTRAAENDACSAGPAPGYACSVDHGSALMCDGGHFAVWRRCRGPDGCRVESDGRIDCDTTRGEPADPCGKRGSYCCSTDQKAMLACDGHVLVAVSSCRGPEGCQFDRESRRVSCADGIAREGDPCEDEGRVSCTVDGALELVCRGATFVKKRECRRTGCHVEGAELFCD